MTRVAAKVRIFRHFSIEAREPARAITVTQRAMRRLDYIWSRGQV